MKSFAIFIAAVLLGVVLLTPCAAQTLQGEAAYQELLRLSDPAGIVVFDGRRYLRAPQGAARLPGGYGGAFDRKILRLPNGQEVAVVDPARPINITKDKGGPEPADLPERVRKIVAALEKLGLHPAITSLPQAMGGHSVEVKIGTAKPGGTFTRIWVHLGTEQKVRVFAESVKGGIAGRGTLKGGAYRAEPYAPTPPWAGVISYPVNPNSDKAVSTAVEFGQQWYQVADLQALCSKPNASVTVAVIRYDSKTKHELVRGLPGNVERRLVARDVELAAGLRSQLENWMKVVTKIIDDVDKAGAPVAAIEPPKTPLPTVMPPPPVVTAPVAPPVKRPTHTARDLFPAGPRQRTVIGPRIEQWITENRAWAVANPVKAAGTVMMGAGAVLLATATAPWTGAALIVGGIGAYQSTKPKGPPPELAVVRDAREKIQKYQEMWNRGFSDAELNDLGIFMDDLSKMTREQRAQVYKDADIEFTNRLQALRDLRAAGEGLSP